MQPYLIGLKKFRPVSTALEQHLEPLVEKKQYKKKDLMLEPGLICRYVWFIEKGLLVIYSHEDGKPKVAWILGAGDFVIAEDSFPSGSRTKYFIEVVEDVTAWCMGKAQLDEACHRFPEFFEHYIAIHEYYREVKAKFSAKSPDERFDEIWDEHLDYFNRVRKQHLMSYFGMTNNMFYNYRKTKRR